MAEKKVTIMVVKVDLNCEKCRKKIKKVLCDIPQIQNQVYDEKANTVTITVVCCNPEKIKKKICCKGGKTVKGIEIKVPEKPKEPQKPKEPAPPKPDKPKELEKPKEPAPPKPDKPKEPEKPKEPAPPKPDKPKEPEKPKEPAKPAPPKPNKPKDPVKPPSKPVPEPVPCYPPPTMLPRACCMECYEGRGGGPCYGGCGRPASPCYEGYGRPVYDSWGGGGYRGPCYVSRCDYYLSEENPAGCIVM